MVWFMATPLEIDTSAGTEALDPARSPLLVEVNPRNPPTNIEMNDMSSDETNALAQPIDEDDEPSGLKLGLGDFVFYSVLVGRASLFDWVVTVGTTLAVLSGLVLTIFILVLKRKPLPALPISIFLGIFIFIVGSLTLSPMIESLLIFEGGDNILRAGSSSARFVYL
jgi:hypothetical protein